MDNIEKTHEYFAWIGNLKKRYRSTQIKAVVSVNSALLEFYWSLGKDISERYPGRKRNASSLGIHGIRFKVQISVSCLVSFRPEAARELSWWFCSCRSSDASFSCCL